MRDAIYRQISDITISMKATDHLQMPELVSSEYTVRLSDEEKQKYAARGNAAANILLDLCFMKFLPERKKSRDFQTKSRPSAIITLSVPSRALLLRLLRQKAAQFALAHFGAAYLRHTRVSRRLPAQTHRHF